MFPATERWGNKASVWKTIPMSRRCGGRSVMSSSSRKTRPSVGRSRPAIIRRSVVLPQPDGPRKEISFPAGNSRSTPATATTSPKRFTSPWSLRPPRAGTVAVGRSALGEDHLRPLLVDPVLPLVVHLVLRTERDLRPRSADGVVLLLGEVHRLLLGRRGRAEGPCQLGLDRWPAHVVDEGLACGDVLRRLRDGPEARVQDRSLRREDAAERFALRSRVDGDVVVELPDRDLPRVVGLLCLGLVSEPELHVRLQLLELGQDLADAVLRLEDVVAAEEHRRGDLDQVRVRRVLQQRELVLPLRVPERRPGVRALSHALGVGDERDVPRDAAHAGDHAGWVGADVSLGEVLGLGDRGGVEGGEDLTVDRALDPHPRQHRDIGGRRRARPARLLELNDPDLRCRLGDGLDLDAELLGERREHVAEVLLEEPAVRADLDLRSLDARRGGGSGGLARGLRRGAARRLGVGLVTAGGQERGEADGNPGYPTPSLEELSTADDLVDVHDLPPSGLELRQATPDGAAWARRRGVPGGAGLRPRVPPTGRGRPRAAPAARS